MYFAAIDLPNTCKGEGNLVILTKSIFRRLTSKIDRSHRKQFPKMFHENIDALLVTSRRQDVIVATESQHFHQRVGCNALCSFDAFLILPKNQSSRLQCDKQCNGTLKPIRLKNRGLADWKSNHCMTQMLKCAELGTFLFADVKCELSTSPRDHFKIGGKITIIALRTLAVRDEDSAVEKQDRSILAGERFANKALT
jgi:hypothetical protein